MSMPDLVFEIWDAEWLPEADASPFATQVRVGVWDGSLFTWAETPEDYRLIARIPAKPAEILRPFALMGMEIDITLDEHRPHKNYARFRVQTPMDSLRPLQSLRNQLTSSEFEVHLWRSRMEDAELALPDA